ncbi:MAG: SEC-C metal-binding domain-containing protein [Geobacteraceae bacterium]
MTIGRNETCLCGSGKKYKKCCAEKENPARSGLKAAIRMKGGVAFDSDANAYRAVVHSWDNAECIGEPMEWLSKETFPTDDAAMNFYKMNIRPGLERLMAEASRKSKDIVFTQHRLE